MCLSSSWNQLINKLQKIALVEAALEASSDSSPGDLESEREDVPGRVISEAVTPHM